MNNKGFTLIELFAVIIVLALLAIITTPAIMDSIDNSKMNGALRSADQLVKAIVLDYTTNDNFTTDELDVLSFKYDGQKPSYGHIKFNEIEKARLYMEYNGYCVIKDFSTELQAIKLNDGDVCNWDTVDSKAGR